MKRSIGMIMIMLSLLCACSNEAEPERRERRTIFESEGEYWKAVVDNTVLERNGKRYFQIRYAYLGDPNDLDHVKKIVFAQGTSLGTQVVTEFEPAKGKESGEFLIEYDLIQDGEGYSALDAIEKDRLNIQIEWETSERAFEDEIK
ncbi:hypothetical protein RB620_14220 [Paenibacillus sp. LHD-117]|uniref:hypothetical protein n=1 Tax=Paenibacillus sp. LHD-117 TaxID=3071412 RepID=UPI0027DF3E70|nr:hypothetical protein [Paenibacillus sp. LHD-117]MDQ6420582.1 hypothetical protein [Paenibacillus sp. LHD-117]